MEGRPASASSYELLFRLHPTQDDDDVLWEEPHTAVSVGLAGQFDVILGQTVPLSPDLFLEIPRYLSVSVLHDGRIGEEASARVPILGLELRLQAALAMVVSQLEPLPVLSKRVRRLRHQLQAFEAGGGALAQLSGQLEKLEHRLSRIDSEEGRLAHLEDEIEDLVGNDGDMIDLMERLEGVEKGSKGGQLLSHFTPVGQVHLHDVVCVQADGRVGVSDRPANPQVVGVVVAQNAQGVSVLTHGIATCKVVGPVTAGDLLVCARTPGHAARASTLSTGTLLGKALQSLEGTGSIPILVTLH